MHVLRCARASGAVASRRGVELAQRHTAQHLSLAMHVEADSMIKRESLTARHLQAETYG